MIWNKNLLNIKDKESSIIIIEIIFSYLISLILFIRKND